VIAWPSFGATTFWPVISATSLGCFLATASGAEYKAANRDNKDDEAIARMGGESRGRVLEAEDFARALPVDARLLGIDLGTKTLGLALSDVTRTIASGLTTLSRGKFSDDARRLLALAEEHGVHGFVIGLPVNLNGTEGPRAQATRAFARNLGRLTSLPILLWDERLSTAAAERSLLEADASRRRRAMVIDKVAATLILQAVLDRLHRFDRA
jgi:putative Holliday junction resolvase